MDSTLPRTKEIGHELKEQTEHTLAALRRETRQKLSDTKVSIREHPRQATLMGFAGGILLSFLPLSAIVTAALRVILFLAKPALLILGGIKIVEEYKKSHPQHSDA